MDLICSEKEFFKNPNKLPLNEIYFDYKKTTRMIKNDYSLEETEEMLKSSTPNVDYYKTEIVKRPALDKCWIDRKRYESYHPYDLHLTEEQNNLFMKNRTFLDNLCFLNDCSYHQFWCYIYYEPNIKHIIKSFFKNAVPLHLVSHLSGPFFNLHVQIHASVQNIYQRLLHFKVSEIEYIREDVARSIIQEKGLLNTDIIFTLCYLYNSSEPQFVSAIIEFCLRKKDSFLRRINELLKTIIDELDKFTQTPFQKTASIIEEKTFFLFEVASTLHQFLSVCTSAIDIAFYLELPYCVTYVYQRIYTEINDIVYRNNSGHEWSTLHDFINKWIAFGKFEFVNLFHVFTTYCLDAIVKLRENSSKQDEYVELYIGLISNALDNDLFVIAYDKTYSIREQFETILDCVPHFDVQQTDYLLKSLDSIISEFSNEPEAEVVTLVPTSTARVVLDTKKYNSIYETLLQYLEKPGSKKSTNLPKNVSTALEQYYELTKQLGSHNELKQEFLSNLNMPSKKEIDTCTQAVLDVLPHLEQNFILECLKKNNYNVNETITKILSNDLSSKIDNPTNKKEKYANANEMLDDKKEKESMKQFVLKASYSLDLDDEYDDRKEMGNIMNNSDDEARIYRHLKGENQNIDNESSSSEEGESAEPQRNTKFDFCTDPSILREQRAQKYHNNRRSIPNKNPEQSNEKPKYNKSSKPKHNRRGGADWKRNKGMIPS